MSEPDEPISQLFVEVARRSASLEMDQARKDALGQFLTPLPVARFMAGLFARWDVPELRLLDAGAGVGSLTAAFLDVWTSRAQPGECATVTAYEVDPTMRRHLGRTL